MDLVLNSVLQSNTDHELRLCITSIAAPRTSAYSADIAWLLWSRCHGVTLSTLGIITNDNLSLLIPCHPIHISAISNPYLQICSNFPYQCLIEATSFLPYFFFLLSNMSASNSFKFQTTMNSMFWILPILCILGFELKWRLNLETIFVMIQYCVKMNTHHQHNYHEIKR